LGFQKRFGISKTGWNFDNNLGFRILAIGICRKVLISAYSQNVLALKLLVTEAKREDINQELVKMQSSYKLRPSVIKRNAYTMRPYVKM
jgi:hypothetical protein